MSVEDAYKVVQKMANEGGCAWHEKQDHQSLTKYLIEETYELVDAIDTNADAEEMESELADVLYQVLFHAAIAERDAEGYDLQSIAARLSEKLIKRHPHVFGDRGYMSVAELEAEWEHLKEAAAGTPRGSRGALDGIPTSLPALSRAAKVLDRLQRAHLIEIEGPEKTSDEIGSELLKIIKTALANGIDPDLALRRATAELANEKMEY